MGVDEANCTRLIASWQRRAALHSSKTGKAANGSSHKNLNLDRPRLSKLPGGYVTHLASLLPPGTMAVYEHAEGLAARRGV